MKIKKIRIKDKDFHYSLRKKRGMRSMRLAIYPDGAFVVTAPKWYPAYIINKFLAEKAEWIYNKLQHIDFAELELRQKAEKNDYQAQKELAREIIQSRVEFFNQCYQLAYNRVSIKNQKSCWGSASRKGNLNFNYKVAFLPEELRDYVVVHELCHLLELNHGKKFWELVARTIPQYKNIRQKLKIKK
ncbi:MAG: SprT family zinc-dependent metalloprotease [Parcubacteria group bacterium]|jgi:hypothetical protein